MGEKACRNAIAFRLGVKAQFIASRQIAPINLANLLLLPSVNIPFASDYIDTGAT